MAWLVEVGRDGARIGKRVDSHGAVGGGDAGSGALLGVHCHREGRIHCVFVGLVLHHERNLEPVEVRAAHADAHNAASVAHHEGERLGGGAVGRKNKVALVLTVLVVQNDDALAPCNRGERRGNGAKARLAGQLSRYWGIPLPRRGINPCRLRLAHRRGGRGRRRLPWPPDPGASWAIVRVRRRVGRLNAQRPASRARAQSRRRRGGDSAQ
mmetsp:Transcript_1090/g.2555  ORF Transcript_1090/g.2555 Transcript_1090/m.2555 type:complete len:211 (-) Transcript_1090:246-878(-)